MRWFSKRDARKSGHLSAVSRLCAIIVAIALVVGAFPATVSASSEYNINIEDAMAGSSIGILRGVPVYSIVVDGNIFESIIIKATSQLYNAYLVHEMTTGTEVGCKDQVIAFRQEQYEKAKSFFLTTDLDSEITNALDESSEHLLFHLYKDGRGGGSKGYLIVEWHAPQAEVDKSALSDLIAKAPSVDDDVNYVHINDRFNGIDTIAALVSRLKEQEDFQSEVLLHQTYVGFWDFYLAAYDNATAVHESGTSLQSAVDNATSLLSIAIENLIAATKVNATALYEVLTTRWVWNGAELTVNHRLDPVSAENCTSSTWEPYAAAKAEAEAFLAGLYYADGSATEDNTADRQAEADRLAVSADPGQLVNASAYADAYQTFRSRRTEAQSLMTLYDPAKLTESDYTGDSWSGYMAAYDALLADLSHTLVGGTKADMTMLSAFSHHIDAFKDARQQLVSDVDINISFTYINNFAAKYPAIRSSGTDLYANQALKLPKGNTTAADAVNAAGIVFDRKELGVQLPANTANVSDTVELLAVYVNDIYLGTDIYTVQLHEGDTVRIVRICAPAQLIEVSSGYDSTSREEVPIYDAALYEDSAAVIHMTAPSESVKVGDKAVFYASVTGANATNLGQSFHAEKISLFISAPGDAEALSQPSRQTASSTDSQGTLEYVFTEPGWYTVAMFNVDDDDMTFTDVYNAVTYGTYYSMFAGDYAVVYVAPADDESAILQQYRGENLEKASSYFKQYHNYDFAEGYYEETFKNQYDILKENLERAETFKILMEQFDTDFAALQVCGAAALDHGAVLSALRANLELLPAGLTDLDAGYRTLLEEIQRAYNDLNDHQKTLLTGNEVALLDQIAAMDLNELTALPSVGVTICQIGELPRKGDNGAANYGWPNIEWASYPQPDGSVPNPVWATAKLPTEVPAGSYVFVRRYLETTEHAYRMMWSVDNGESWHASEPQTLTDQFGTKIPDYYLVRYQIPRDSEDGSSVTIQIKMFSKAEYEAFLVAQDAEGLEEVKTAAQAALQAAYDGYDKSKYDQAGKAALQKAMEEGAAAVASALTNDAVAEARRAALAAMAAVKVIGSSEIPGVEASFDSGKTVGRVHVIIENTTYEDLLYETFVDGWYDLGENDSMMTVFLKALESKGYTWNGTTGFDGSQKADYSVTYISSITKSGQTLAEFTAGQKSGWMGTLNDWFTNEGFQAFSYTNGKLENGDEIRLMYTCSYGADLGGTWGELDTSLESLTVSGGVLTPSFSGSIWDYMLIIPSDRENVQLYPVPSNKNYQFRIFLNDYNRESAYYKRTETISVTTGDTVYVGVGENGWPTMNSGGQSTRYTLKVCTLKDAIETLPADHQVTIKNYGTYQETAELLRSMIQTQKYEGDAKKLENLEARILFYAQIDSVKALLADIPAADQLIKSDGSKVSAARTAYDALVKNGKGQELYITVSDVAKYNAAVEWLEKQGISTGGKISGSEIMPGSSVIEQTTEISGGTATAIVTEKAVSSALEAALESGDQSITIIPTNTGNATSIAAELPKTAAQRIAGSSEMALSIETTMGTVTISNHALASIVSQAGGGTVTITMAQKSAADVQNRVDAKLLEKAVICEITVKSGGAAVTEFGGGTLTVDLPADETIHRTGSAYKVVVIGADGAISSVPGRCFKEHEKLAVRVTIAHLSTFIVTTEKTMPFRDLDGHWAYDAVVYVYEKGWMNGTGETAFRPDGTMSRAMLTTILYRLAEEPEVNASGAYSDVADGTWYADAVAWAGENRIAGGVGGGRFAPEAPVTREQMAAMLYNYAAYRKYDTTRSAMAIREYADYESISGWALSAMDWANASGLITGRTASAVVPGGTATRAEAATILMRFAETAAK